MTCLCHLSVNAQFVDVSNNLQLSTDHTGGFLGSGVSFADFNGDDAIGLAKSINGTM